MINKRMTAAAIMALAGMGIGVVPTAGQYQSRTVAQAPSVPGGDVQPAQSSSGVAATRRRFMSAGSGSGRGGFKNWPPRTVAQDKRDARKARNVRRARRAK